MKEIKKEEATSKIAEKILENAKCFLITRLPFMCISINKLQYVPDPEIKNTIMTDGENFYYSPERIVGFFRIGGTSQIARMILHTVLHCIFRHHRFPRRDIIWHTACDVTVETVIDSLGIWDRNAGDRSSLSCLTKEELESLTSAPSASVVLLRLTDDGKNAAKAVTIRNGFYVDCHDLWYQPVEKSGPGKASADEKQRKKGSGGEGDDTDEAGEGNGDDTDEPDGEDGDGNGEAQSGTGKDDADQETRNGKQPGSGDRNRPGALRTCGEQKQDDWENISRQTEMMMKQFGGIFPGIGTDRLFAQIDSANREKYDFRSVLKRFAANCEVTEINPDEYDMTWYTTGLELYGDMPLIEPTETQESNRLRDFVIVIDTSGSTEGELVKKFVNLTYTILKSEELFQNEINIHIIQCDWEIREHVKITSQTEFDEYIKNMKLRGFGGTSFVPVFKEVEKMRENDEFRDLKGLIYFTDGYGSFPDEPTEYETIFVYLKENEKWNNMETPSWITKLVLTQEEMMEV